LSVYFLAATLLIASLSAVLYVGNSRIFVLCLLPFRSLFEKSSKQSTA